MTPYFAGLRRSASADPIQIVRAVMPTPNGKIDFAKAKLTFDTLACAWTRRAPSRGNGLLRILHYLVNNDRRDRAPLKRVVGYGITLNCGLLGGEMIKGNWALSLLILVLALAPAEARFVQTDPVGYQDDNNPYVYVHNDPTDNLDPTGKDTQVQLQYYIIGNAPIQGDYGHQYIYMRDTDTGETAISRGGPSAPYIGGVSGAVSNSPSKNAAGSTVTAITQMKPEAQSIDAGQGGRPVTGSTVTLKEPIDKAEDALKVFNKAVDSANIPYTPRQDNSNAYAGTAYQVLTGKTPPSSSVLPGSEHSLSPQIPACASDPKICGSK